MAKKKEEQDMRQAYDAWMKFMKLCGLLFNPNSDAIYNINELKEDSEYYQHARDLCEEMEIDWDGMTHEDSNRVMLALLDDHYNDIQIDKEKDYVFKIKIEEKCLKQKE